MNYLLHGLRVTFGLRLRSMRTWALVLILPVLVLTASALLPSDEVSAPVQVGVALPEDGAREFWDDLCRRSGTVMTFILSDPDTIDRNVAAGRWDCGLILAEDFDKKLQNLDTGKLITLRIGPGSTVYPLVREAVFASAAELLSPVIAREYLLDSGIAKQEEMDLLLPLLEEILPEESRVILSLTTLDGTPLDPLDLADQSVAVILRWLISAIILVWLLLAATDLGRWLDSPAARRLKPLRSTGILALSRVGADVIFAGCSGILALILLGDGWASWLSLLAYVFYLGTLASLLARVRPVWTALPIIMPFVPVVSLLLSPVIVDLSAMYPALSGITSHLSASLFLGGCAGNLFCTARLAVTGLFLLALDLIADRMAIAFWRKK